VRPALRPLSATEDVATKDFCLLIGDRALDFLFESKDHAIWDLGAAWLDLTQLPFVYAVWALRRDIDHKALRRKLREARDFGIETLDSIIRDRAEYTLEFRRDYLSWHVHYHLGSDEKRGIAKFAELLRRHEIGIVTDPRYVF
jgi:chorismate dehydratase